REPVAHGRIARHHAADALRPAREERHRTTREERRRMNCMADGKLRIEAVVRRVRDGLEPHARKGLLLAAAVALAACAPKGEALYERAGTSIAAGEFRAAVIDLKNLVKSEPDNARARALLAYALAKNGEIAAAE